MAKEPSTDLKFTGLFTNGNAFSSAPPGAMSQADNCVIRSPDLLESRRGVDTSTTLNSFYGNAAAIVDYPHSFDGSSTFASNPPPFATITDAGWVLQTVPGFTSSTNSYPVQFAPGYIGLRPPAPTTFVPQTATANEALFFTAASGVMKYGDYLTAVENTGNGVNLGSNLLGIRRAGAPATPYMYCSGASTLGVGLDTLPAFSTVAYRAVFGRFDYYGYLILSAPSERVVVTNSTSSAVSPTLQIIVPHEVYSDTQGTTAQGTAWFLQIYRTAYNTYGSAGSAADPGDEQFQVYEFSNLTSGLTSTISYTDSSTTLQASYPLYTNASTGSGIDSANDRPPVSRAIGGYRSFTLFGNTYQPQSVTCRLLGASALTSGVSQFVLSVYTGFPLKFQAFHFTAGAANNYLTQTFALQSTGVAYADTEATARNLVLVINQFFHPANRSALIAAGVTLPPVGTAFAVEATYTTDYSDTTPGQFTVQNTYGEGLGIFVSGTDTAAWSGLGNSDNSAAQNQIMWSLDSQPEAVPLDNFALVGDPLRPITAIKQLGQSAFIFKQNDGVWWLTGADPTTFDIRQFDSGINLVAPRTVQVLDGSIFCFTMKGVEVFTESGKLPAPISRPIERELLALRANNSNFDTAAFAVAYESEGLYILAVPASSSDPGCSLQYVYSLNSQSWTRWTVPGLTAGGVMSYDNRLWLGAGPKILRERKALDSTDYQDDGAAIAAAGQFLPLAPGSPLLEKKFSDVYWSFAKCEPSTVTLGISTDRQTGTTTQSKTTTTSQAWGNFAWGNVPWGSNSQNLVLRQDVPQGCANGSMVNLSFSAGQAGCQWQLQGVSIQSEAVGGNLRR